MWCEVIDVTSWEVKIQMIKHWLHSFAHGLHLLASMCPLPGTLWLTSYGLCPLAPSCPFACTLYSWVQVSRIFLHPHWLWVQKVQSFSITAHRIWVSAPPQDIPTTQPAFLWEESSIHRSLYGFGSLHNLTWACYHNGDVLFRHWLRFTNEVD